jgi:hypothetical protein
MEKLFALLALFRQGNAVADPALWKTGGISAAALVGLVLALDRVGSSFGHPLGITQTDAQALAGGVLVLAHIVLTVVTSDKVGLPPLGEPRVDSGGDAGRNGGNQSPNPGPDSDYRA